MTSSIVGKATAVQDAPASSRMRGIGLVRSDEAMGVLLVLAFAVAWPVFARVGLMFWAEVANRILVLALAATSLNLLMGVAGLNSMGHAIYFGIGAYCVGIPAYYGVETGYMHLALVIAISAAVGAGIGALALRTRGAHFIMLTLAFGQMVYFTILCLREYGGDDGLVITSSSVFSGSFELSNRPTLYYVSLGALSLALLGFARVKRSRFGLVLAAANQSEVRVAASGFNVSRYRLVAFVIAACVCGVAGFLNANLTNFVTPDLVSWKQSALFMFMVVLGGTGTVCGPILGACAFVLIEQLLGSKTAYWEFWFGVFLMVAVVGIRQGLANLLSGRAGGRE